MCEEIVTDSLGFGYFSWYVENCKPHILTEEERARELSLGTQRRPPAQRPGRGRGRNVQEEPPATPMPQPSWSPQFAPPSEGFFTDVLQPFMSATGVTTVPMPLTSYYPPPPAYVPEFAPMPQFPYFGSSSGIVDQTPPQSLFYTGPSGSVATSGNVEGEDDEKEEDPKRLQRRNPRRDRRPPRCGTGGHRRH